MKNWYDPQSISNPDLVYLDTWVYRFLIDNTEYTSKLFNYLLKNILYPAISDILLIELSPKQQYIEKISFLLCSLNSILVRNSYEIMHSEVENYPRKYYNSIIVPNGYLLADLFTLNIKKSLSSNQVGIEWDNFRSDSRKMKKKLEAVINNYPLGNSGKYVKEQAEEFAKILTVQWLSKEHPEFIKLNFDKNTINNIKIKMFKGLQTYAYYIFYKYYIGKRKADKISDFGDLFHLFYIPYCKLAVLERDQCSILRKIQKDSSILENVRIENIDFIKTL